MKRLLPIVLSLIFLANLSHAQLMLQRQWTSFHNGTLNGHDRANAIITDANGNVYVTGQSIQNSSNGSITTVMYDSAGAMIWTDNYKGNITYAQNSGEDICLDPFGNVLVTGTVAMNDGDLSIVKFNQQGRIWAKNKEPWYMASDVDFAKEIATDNLGNIYCVASIMSIGGNLQDLFTLKCDSAGNDIWSAVYPGSSVGDWAEGLAVTPDGHCYSIASAYNAFGSASWDMQTVHYDSSGAQQWVSSYNYQVPQSEDYPMDIQCDVAKNTWVCGAADIGATTDMVGYKQNLYGTRLWTTTYNGTANGNDTAIAISYFPNDLTVVTGRSQELVNGMARTAITTMLIDSGTVVWTRNFFGDSLDAVPTAMITDAAGLIYISGYYETVSEVNGVVLVYDQAGNLLFTDNYLAGAGLNTKFNDLVTDVQGYIYVTGQTATSTNNSNYVTIKYAVPGTIGIAENQIVNSLLIYPNPASEEINIVNMDSPAGVLTIKDMKGKSVYAERISENTTVKKLAVENFAPGMYLVEFISGKKYSAQKLIIN